MSKVVMLPLGLFVDNQPRSSLHAFIGSGVSFYSILWHWFPLPKFLHRLRYKAGEPGSITEIIDDYKVGNINTEQFKQILCKRFPNAERLFEFDWNMQCTVTSYTQAAFEEVEAFLKESPENKVYFFSGTNPLHVEHITKHYPKGIPGTSFFSYDHKALNKDLLRKMFEEVRKNYPDKKTADILCFYAEPENPFSNLGFLAWLRHPIEKWIYHQSQKYTAQIRQEARNYGIILVRYERNGVVNGKLSTIREHIQRFENNPEASQALSSAPVVTPALALDKSKNTTTNELAAAQMPKDTRNSDQPHKSKAWKL